MASQRDGDEGVIEKGGEPPSCLSGANAVWFVSLNRDIGLEQSFADNVRGALAGVEVGDDVVLGGAVRVVKGLGLAQRIAVLVNYQSVVMAKPFRRNPRIRIRGHVEAACLPSAKLTATMV